MSKYDFFIAGRWRNKDSVKSVLDLVRAHNKSAYCFLENDYKGEIIELKMDGDPEVFMAQLEDLPQDHPFIRKIFEIDMRAERESDTFLLVFPAGTAAHIEAGVAYGLGKRCIAIGALEKTETLYDIFDHIFPTVEALEEWLRSNVLFTSQK